MCKDWEKIEREEHNNIYRNSFPFDSKDYKIDKEHVIWWEDYCYKKNRRKDRGHRTRRLFELINLKSLEGKTILDVGCGNGQYSVFFAFYGANVYGIDISPVGISIAEKIAAINGLSNKCSFSTQNITNIDFQEEFFDVIILHEALHHIIKYPNVKQELLRVLKKGGKIFCAESLDGNIFLKIGRIFTMKGQEQKGDIILTLKDMENFAQGFSKSNIEMMSLIFMIKRIFVHYINVSLVRWFLFLVKKSDDILLRLFPFLEKYCGECIMVLTK